MAEAAADCSLEDACAVLGRSGHAVADILLWSAAISLCVCEAL